MCRRRVHGEATECVVFMGRQRNASCSSGGNGTHGSQPAWMEQAMETRPEYHRTEETALCSTGHIRNGILFIGRGLAYRKMEETDLCWTSYGRNGVRLIGRGVAY